MFGNDLTFQISEINRGNRFMIVNLTGLLWRKEHFPGEQLPVLSQQ